MLDICDDVSTRRKWPVAVPLRFFFKLKCLLGVVVDECFEILAFIAEEIEKRQVRSATALPVLTPVDQ